VIKTKDIEGYEGLYAVRTDGVILRYLKSGDGKILKGSVDKNGYVTVALSDTSYNKSGIRTMFVHRLVAKAFIHNDDPTNKVQVDHIDENKARNGIDNLRWCTPQQNVSYYSNKDGRAFHTKLRNKHKKLIDRLIKELRVSRKEVAIQQKIIAEGNKALEALRVTYSKAEDELLADIDKFERYKEVELKKLEVKGANLYTYSSKQGDRKKVTSKPITVDGIVFPSAYSAAKHIVEEEEKLGNHRTHNTISKELRRFIAGKRPSWSMYGLYRIGH